MFFLWTGWFSHTNSQIYFCSDSFKMCSQWFCIAVALYNYKHTQFPYFCSQMRYACCANNSTTPHVMRAFSQLPDITRKNTHSPNEQTHIPHIFAVDERQRKKCVRTLAEPISSSFAVVLVTAAAAAMHTIIMYEYLIAICMWVGSCVCTMCVCVCLHVAADAK